MLYSEIMDKANGTTFAKVAYVNDAEGRRGIFAREPLTEQEKTVLNVKFVGRQPRIRGEISLYRYIHGDDQRKLEGF